jgi:Ca-activated chloride channel family protein
MKFAEPIWLVAGLAAIVTLFWLFRRFDARQRAALAEFASSHLLAKLTASFSPGRRRLKRVLFATAIAFTFVALARPQLGFHWEEEKQRGIDILFAIDTSKSMLTQDVTPDRLTRAKLAITDFVRKLEGDRVGLIAFAGDAFLQAPLTLDYDAFQESLDAIDTNTIPRGGTDVASAIQEAQAAFGKESKNKKILVLITDGEDLEAKGIEAARTAASNGLTIYTVGVGSASGGLIPVPGANGGTDFVKDDTGQFVKSHLDESTLKQIAEATSGVYEPLGQQGQGLVTLYNQVLASIPKHDLSSRRQKVYDERFQWPLGIALAFLLASTMIGTRKRSATTVARPQKAVKSAAMVGALAVMACAPSAQASPQEAEQAYKKGDFTTAEKQYQQAAEQSPQKAPLQFDVGAAAYKTGDYGAALPAFQKALGTDDVAVQQQSYYNMGNTQYRVGQKTEKSKPDETIKTWTSAVQSYDAALKLKPDDADAKFNRDFVQKKLDELQKQQKQDQKEDQQNQKQDQKDQKDQQNQQNQKQDQQNQQQSGSKQDQKNDQQNQQNQQKQDQSQGGQGDQKDQKQSGQDQNQAQNGKQDQQKKDGQQGQPKQDQAQNGKQDQQKQDQAQNGQQGQQNQNDQQQNGGDQNSQTAKNDEKPAGPRGATIPDKDQSQKGQAAEEAQTGTPGEMTKEEARELLNSLKNNEHALPVTADARNGANHPADQQTIKDW